MSRKRLLWQLFPSYLAVTVLSLLAVTWYASSAARGFFLGQIEGELTSRARAVGRDVSADLLVSDPAKMDAYCKEVGKLTETRITVIRPDGVVVADSDADPATMENHSDRPEIRAALESSLGQNIRRSPTLQADMMYVAIAAADQHGNRLVVRTAMFLTRIDQTVRELQRRIFWAGLGVAFLGALVCLLVSRRIARPIEEVKRGVERLAAGDLGHRLHVRSSEEIESLARALNEMAVQLDDRIRTITAQRNEQEAVFTSMAEGVIAVDMRERVLRMNQAAGTLLGADPVSAQGKTIQEVVRNSDLQKFVSLTLTSRAATEHEIAVRDGGEHWVQLHGAALNDASGRKMGAVVVLNDLTRMRRLERFRSDFVANVSHELRTPVTAIKGFVETLLDGAAREPESAEKFLGIIARQTDRLNAIINDLLLLSRLEASEGKGAISLEETAVSAVLAAAVELCAPKAEAKRIAVAVQCDATLRARINAPLVEQAVTNLVDNAVKYSEPGKAVRVEAEQRADALVISVRDEGCGIEKEHLPRIFERFYRVDKGRSREMGGTGLGLAIVKHIAQAHGGSVTVESVPGRGSVFTFAIPSPQRPDARAS